MGKVIGGGLPVGAFGGRADVMAQLAPSGPVYQAGTLSGNPLATAAGLAVLDLLDEAAYDRLRAGATRLGTGLQEAFDAVGVEAVVSVVGSLVGLFFGPRAPHDYAEARTTDEARYAAFFHAMIERGVALAPGAYEVSFPGLAHTDQVIDEVVDAARDAAKALV
jgi:glutamate-1-semialdehyde 2,1-aminomutase